MSTLPKFLVCENSAEDPLSVFIVHTEYPRFIAKSNSLSEEEGFTVINETDPIALHYEGDYFKLTALLQEMQQWYTDCLIAQL